jgi:hypothetical protein
MPKVEHKDTISVRTANQPKIRKQTKKIDGRQFTNLQKKISLQKEKASSMNKNDSVFFKIKIFLLKVSFTYYLRLLQKLKYFKCNLLSLGLEK